MACLALLRQVGLCTVSHVSNSGLCLLIFCGDWWQIMPKRGAWDQEKHLLRLASCKDLLESVHFFHTMVTFDNCIVCPKLSTNGEEECAANAVLKLVERWRVKRAGKAATRCPSVSVRLWKVRVILQMGVILRLLLRECGRLSRATQECVLDVHQNQKGRTFHTCRMVSFSCDSFC